MLVWALYYQYVSMQCVNIASLQCTCMYLRIESLNLLAVFGSNMLAVILGDELISYRVQLTFINYAGSLLC